MNIGQEIRDLKEAIQNCIDVAYLITAILCMLMVLIYLRTDTDTVKEVVAVVLFGLSGIGIGIHALMRPSRRRKQQASATQGEGQ